MGNSLDDKFNDICTVKISMSEKHSMRGFIEFHFDELKNNDIIFAFIAASIELEFYAKDALDNMVEKNPEFEEFVNKMRVDRQAQKTGLWVKTGETNEH